MRIRVSILLMILSAMFMFPAYGETDVFGNPIEWDMEAEPDEDFIGNDDTDFMEPPTYTDEEKQQVMILLPESTSSNLYGEFLVTGDFNSLWPNLNVVIVLYDENNHRWEDTVYEQNQYQLRMQLPVGEYKVYRCFVPGDEGMQRYPLEWSENKVMIRADSTAQMKISQQIEAGSAKGTEKQTVEDKIQPVFDDTHEKLTGVLTALAILLIIPVLLMIVSMLRKRVGEKGRYQ